MGPGPDWSREDVPLPSPPFLCLAEEKSFHLLPRPFSLSSLSLSFILPVALDLPYLLGCRRGRQEGTLTFSQQGRNDLSVQPKPKLITAFKLFRNCPRLSGRQRTTRAAR
ncbi:hypothetical protein GWI33_012698 [Rhynchophorus ferrugineus]|uniref:Uncharacterized protein n=1 Tax=Rhynchophorus ferrugineus TaxID=354439 RepID=A0A834I531_RHYFE|nr:hypothetical protein GWI33_012698 [Rhynchophorus ferrugineus]